jgi:DNA segregation ATPase FtsK/SpoIIIE, S-DNA-T family
VVRPEQRRELAGFGLLAVALFFLLALVPARLLGEAGAQWFPSGNLLGVAGDLFRTGTVRLLGVGAGLLPFLVGLTGLFLSRRLGEERALRLAVFSGGLLVLLPTFLAFFPVGSIWTGLLGRGLARPLASALGVFGGALLVGVLAVLLSMATLAWNPLAAPSRWLVRGARSGAGTLWDWLEGRRVGFLEGWAERRRAARERAAGIDRDRDPELDPDSAGLGAPPGDHEPEPLDPPAPFPRKRGGQTDMGLLPDPRDPRELEGEELPEISLLTAPKLRNRRDMDRELDALGDILVEKLQTFNVECSLGGRTTGPVVTQYEVVPAPGVKVNRIANLEADLALAMRARTIRIVAPIPGRGAVGVEIPNPAPEVVQLREIIENPRFGASRADLPLALGKDLEGAPYVADLARMPHALIAGATGSGKSVCLNTIITSLVYRHTPETLRLLLIDPKMVELSTYGDLPHLRHPVVTDPNDAAGVLKWAVLEMERRYELLSRNGVRSIAEFNRRYRKGVTMRRADADGEEGDPDRWIYDDGVLPFIVLVVDELADLMMTVQSEIEKPLTLLAQKARAIGIHLIVATQRPSVNVITGLIKANFPCRIAFRVASKTDSRTILDQNGADALLGNGDMLFLPPGESAPVRIQGAYIATEETERLMGWFRDLRARKLEEGTEAPQPAGAEDDILEVVRALEAEGAGQGDDPFDGEWDEHFREAAEICISNQQGSTSLLQRKLRVGYGRAARIVDQLHEAGVLGPPDGSRPREVLMGMEQLDRIFSGGGGD